MKHLLSISFLIVLTNGLLTTQIYSSPRIHSCPGLEIVVELVQPTVRQPELYMECGVIPGITGKVTYNQLREHCNQRSEYYWHTSSNSSELLVQSPGSNATEWYGFFSVNHTKASYGRSLTTTMHGQEWWRHTPNNAINLKRLTTAQLLRYFLARNYTQEQILSHPFLYRSCAYLALVKQFHKYPEYVQKYYNRYTNYSPWTRFWRSVFGYYEHKLADRFAQLFEECELVRIKAEERAQKQKVARKITAYHAEMNTLEHHVIPQAVYDAGCVAPRMAALENWQQNPTLCTTYNTPIDDAVRACAQQYGITKNALSPGNLDAYAYQLHTEFMQQLNTLSNLTYQYAAYTDLQFFIDAVGEGITIGIEANQHAKPLAATTWADYCWGALAVAQKIITDGIIQGAQRSVHFVTRPAVFLAHSVMHPKELAYQITQGISTLCNHYIDALGIAHMHVSFDIKGNIKQHLNDAEAVVIMVENLASQCASQVFQMSKVDIATYAVAYGVEWVLTGKIVAMGVKLCVPMLKSARSALSTLEYEKPATELVMVTTDGLAHEKVIFNALHDEMVAEKVAYPSLVSTPRIVEKTVKTLIPTWVDIQAFYNHFDGKCIFNGRSVHVDYEHLLSIAEIIKIKRSGHMLEPKLYGWHHDYLRKLQKSGVVSYEKILEGVCGAFEAEPIVNGIKYSKKTFFPSHWSEEKVVEKIFEAFNKNIIKNTVIDASGCHTIIGSTSCGLEIKLIFDPAKSLITTAFPIIKKII